MTAAIAVRQPPRNGLRPVDLSRDLPWIAELIELCFGPVLDRAGWSAVREMKALGRARPLLWLLAFLTDSLPSWGLGYVWEEDGRLVGNISMQRSPADPREWVIANVAVHPQHRRRGIARTLTRAALSYIRAQGARSAVLQVDDDNAAAIDLYRGLGFMSITARTLWTRPPGAPPAHRASDFDVRPRSGEEWRAQYALAREVMPDGRAWLHPLRPMDFRPSLSTSLSRAMAGQWREDWVAHDGGQLVGSVTVLTNDGGYDSLTLLASPGLRGRIEAPLLIRALRRLGPRPWPAQLEHPANVPESEAAFAQLNFHARRTLLWMRTIL